MAHDKDELSIEKSDLILGDLWVSPGFYLRTSKSLTRTTLRSFSLE